MERASISGATFRTAFVLLLVLAISLLFLAVAWPFLKPLLLGAMLAGLCRPLYRTVTRWCKGRRSLASVLTLLILFVLVAAPVSAFLGVAIRRRARVRSGAPPGLQTRCGSASQFDAHEWLVPRSPMRQEYIPAQPETVDDAAPVAHPPGRFLVAGPPAMTAGTALFL